MKYPQYAEVNGKRRKINTSYRVGIRCFDVINDPSISDEERAVTVIWLLFGEVPPEEWGEYLRVAKTYLTCGETGGNTGKRDMDFSADAPYIEASLLSDYGIDLSVDPDMHFWRYITLIRGLTEKCVLSRIRELRNFDLSEIKDPKHRKRVADAKAAFALPEIRTPEEKAAEEEFNALFEG